MTDSPNPASLGQPDWMTAAPAVAVMDALEARGGADCARFVGGCVRNTLIGAAVADIDIATRLSPREVIEALAAAKLKSVPTGVEHGTVTAIAGGRPYEITTLRRDVETDGRRAVVAFTDDWGEDARRRDFTLNALYAHRDGAIFDPTGHGVADARAGRIVFVGEPRDRIEEDYLRILRFFRFLAWYGRGEPDAAALGACAALKDQVATLSAERISKELLKLLAADDPRPAVALMAKAGVLAVALPAGGDLQRFEALAAIDADPVDRLAAALAPEPELHNEISPKDARRILYKLGAQAFRDRAKLNQVSLGGEHWPSIIAYADGWTRPVLPVTGADALAAGAPRGPMVGQALRAVEDWWIAGDFQPGRDAALEKLRAAAAGMAS